MNENIFDKLDFGPFRSLLDNDDITDISYDNGGQIWIRSLTQGSMRVEIEGATPEFVEKLAFQCSNVMGTTFNNAKPFLDAESAELRMNFVHQSIATNGIALVIRKTPAKIRLEKEKLIKEDYFTPAIHDLLIKCVEGHCNIMVAGETGSGKTEFVKYLASHTITNEKIITIEDTLELHLDRIYPERDIVAMKTNNVASYTDVLVTCMRQNPKWILLSEVRSAEAVSAVRNSISSGHNILSTIHADKASAIPYRLYSLMETDLDVNQFLNTIYRYIQIGVHIRAYYSKEYGQFHREVDEVCEFYVDSDNKPVTRIIYQKQFGNIMMCKPSTHLVEYLENQNMSIQDIIKDLPNELPLVEASDDSSDTDGGNSMDPGVKEEDNTPIILGAELGHEESVPTITSDGNVPLSTPVVMGLNSLIGDSVNNGATPNAQVVNAPQVGQEMAQVVSQSMAPMIPVQQVAVVPQGVDGSVPVMNTLTAMGDSNVSTSVGMPVMTSTQDSVPVMTAPQVMPGADGGVPVMNTTPAMISANGSVPVVDNVQQVQTPPVDGNIPVIGSPVEGTVPVLAPTDGGIPVVEAPVEGTVPVLAPTDGGIPVVEAPVEGTVSVLAPTDGGIPVVDAPVEGTVPVLTPTDGGIPVVETPVEGTVPVLAPTDGGIPVVEAPVEGTVPVLATDTVIPIVQETQTDTPLPIDSGSTSGGPVIPNIVKLDQ